MDKRKGDHRKEKLEGQTYNYLFVKEYLGYGNYLCVCTACNNQTKATSTELKKGLKKSCGCLKNKLLKASQTKHGDSYTRLYKIYKGIKRRCYGTSDKQHIKNYRDRGITMCEEWLNDWLLFKCWAYDNGYNDTLTIERVDNNKGYCPENCRWIPFIEQAKNRSTSFLITINNETHTVTDWCKINHVSLSAAQKRIETYGWNPEKAVTTPARSYIKYGPYSRKRTQEIIAADMLASKVDNI